MDIRLSSRLVTSACVVALAGLASACASNQKTASAYMEQQAMLQQQQMNAEQPAISNRQVHLDMIKTMQSRSLYFASLAHIDAYEKAHGSNPESEKMRADSLRATGQTQSARTHYQRLLNTSEAAAARHGLGLLAAQEGDHAETIRQLRDAVRVDPLNAAALGDLGYALMQQGDPDAARVPLIQAIELAPDNRKIISNLALYLLITGDKDKAMALMNKTGVSTETQQGILEHAQKMSSARAPSIVANASDLLNPNGMQLRLQTTLTASPPSGQQQ